MIRFHDSFTLAQVAQAARLLDARIEATGDGHHVLIPRSAERHTNSNVVPMPRRKGRINPSYLTPTGPEVA